MHLSSSLEKLVEKQAGYIANEILSFSEYIKVTPINELRKLFPAMSIQFPDNIKFLCMLRKGVFPYDWFTSLDQLTYNKIIPFEEFYSKLKKSHIPKEDYKHYTEVWDLFQMKTFKQYLELYLLTDVLLLNDVCERYISCMMTVYDLYPFHFISAPSFSLRAALKITKACIQ